jgi:hypothetical protein
VTSTLCSATFSNSYVKWCLRYMMLCFVAVPWAHRRNYHGQLCKKLFGETTAGKRGKSICFLWRHETWLLIADRCWNISGAQYVCKATTNKSSKFFLTCDCKCTLSGIFSRPTQSVHTYFRISSSIVDTDNEACFQTNKNTTIQTSLEKPWKISAYKFDKTTDCGLMN